MKTTKSRSRRKRRRGGSEDGGQDEEGQGINEEGLEKDDGKMKQRFGREGNAGAEGERV